MIRIAAALFIFSCGYYTFTYGRSLWKDDNNKLGGFGVAVAAFIGTMLPVLYMFYKM